MLLCVAICFYLNLGGFSWQSLQKMIVESQNTASASAKRLEGVLYEPIEFKFSGYIKSGKDGAKPVSELQRSKTTANVGSHPSLEESDEFTLRWPKVMKIGPGLYNCGNTCFLNSVLQCLTYTAPFASYCLKKKHRAKCKISSTSTSFCVLCFFEEHINKVFSTNERVIVPNAVVKNLKAVCSRFRLGRQEDSHELLILLIDKMQSNLFGNPKKLEKAQAEKSVLSQIFMGSLKSTVECLSCKGTSDRLETCFDLCLVQPRRCIRLIT